MAKYVKILDQVRYFLYSIIRCEVYEENISMIKVAVCEDSEIDRSMLEEIVGFLMTDRGLEYEIIPYLNGEELVAGYKNHPYDLIFLDVMMNEIDGIETGKMIRQMD